MLLALETASGVPAVALLRGERLLAEAAAPAGSRGAESLLPCIDRVLAAARLGLDEVEAFGVSAGPGSFTGLRVGVATVKGLAFGDARPVAAVSTLEAVACAARADAALVVAVLDAQRGEFYAAGFVAAGASGARVPAAPPEGVYRSEELAGMLEPGCVLAGPGAAVLAASLGTAPRRADERRSLVHAVGLLAQRSVTAGRAQRAEDLVPRYLRRAEAEVRRTGQRFE